MKQLKKGLVVLALLSIAFAAFAAEKAMKGEGKYTSKDLVDLPAFHAIDVRGDAQVSLVQRSEPSVTVSGLANLVALANVHVKDGVLIVEYKEPIHVKGQYHLYVSVIAPEIKHITVTDMGDVKVRGMFKGTELHIKAHEKGEVSMDGVQLEKLNIHADKHADVEVEDLHANHVHAAIYDKAELELSGKATKTRLENHGAGELNAEDLHSTHVEAVMAGSGKISAYPDKMFHANVIGTGKISYKGSPAEMKREGKLKHIQWKD